MLQCQFVCLTVCFIYKHNLKGLAYILHCPKQLSLDVINILGYVISSFLYKITLPIFINCFMRTLQDYLSQSNHKNHSMFFRVSHFVFPIFPHRLSYILSPLGYLGYNIFFSLRINQFFKAIILLASYSNFMNFGIYL